MASITTGTGLGLFNTTANLLGGQYAGGNAQPGRAGQSDAVYVNSLTGNLVVLRQDEYLLAEGLDPLCLRRRRPPALRDREDLGYRPRVVSPDEIIGIPINIFLTPLNYLLNSLESISNARGCRGTKYQICVAPYTSGV